MSPPPTTTQISERDLLSLTGLSRENLLWLIQALFSGSLWLVGEFLDPETGGENGEEGDLQEILDGMTY